MKESMWGYAILAFGVMIIGFMLLVQNLTSTTEEDFYLSREVLEASMYDAIDYGTYAKSGKLVMSEAKFVEVFLRRFAESVNNSKDYTINFYDIHEYPPKATVTITTATGTETILSEDVNINMVTYLNAILETTYSNNVKRKVCTGDKSVKYDKEKSECHGEGTYAYKVNTSSPYNLDNGTVKLEENTTLYLTFRFLADNDSCGYYFVNSTSAAIPNYMTKNASEPGISKLYEYCYARDNNNNYYYVKKEDLIAVE